MGVVNSAEDVCRLAVGEVGEDQASISSITTPTEPQEETCAEIYPVLRERLLSIHPWRFATGKKALVPATAPLNVWAKAHTLPPQIIGQPLAVFNSGSEGATPIAMFELQGRELLSNETTIVVDYRFQPSESDWPGYFVDFVSIALAARLAMPLASNRTLRDGLHLQAWGAPSENMKGGLYAQAKEADGFGSPNTGAFSADPGEFISARFGG